MQLIFGWFSADSVSPGKNLNVVDLSSSVQEGSSKTGGNEIAYLMYSDEFGTLRHAQTLPTYGAIKNSPILPNDEISISNKFLQIDKELNNNYTNRLEVANKKNYVHSYYVSRYYTIQSSLISGYSGIDTTSTIPDPDSLNIKVVDSSGNKFVDSSGKKMYEVILQRYSLDNSSPERQGAFYKIIVLLPVSNAINLYLIYDKCELTIGGISKNQFLGYKETINSVPFYEKVAEESEVVDHSSYDKRVYSTQLFSHKSAINDKAKVDQPGWKSYVPKKAIQDPRTFQSFNWRLVAKVLYNFNVVKDIYSNDQRTKIRAAVIYAGSEVNPRYPYIFANAESSPFNINSYIFENPASSIIDKSSRDYWKVNLDEDSIFNYDFDFLFWSPTNPISEDQARKLIELNKKGISIFLDCSRITSLPLQKFGAEHLGFNFSSTRTSTGLIEISDSYVNANQTINAWSLSDFNESSTSGVRQYGIFGLRKNLLNQATQMSVKCFKTDSDFSSIQNSVIARVGSNALIFRKSYNTQNTIAANAPSIYFCSDDLSTYVNDPYPLIGFSPSSQNNKEKNELIFNQTGSPSTDFSSVNPIIEGPSKIFYNIISESIKNKVLSSRTTVADASFIWHVSPWRNSWTINGKNNSGQVTVLTDQEKTAYNFSEKTEIKQDQNSQNAKKFFAREIHVKGTSSISQMLVNDFVDSNINDASILARDFSNVEFYIECTNDNVQFVNFSKVDSSDYLYGQKVSSLGSYPYNVFKLSAEAFNQIRNLSPVELSAYSIIDSIEFDFSSIGYPYILVDESDYLSSSSNEIKIPKAYLGEAQQVKKYNFDLDIEYSYKKITEVSSQYLVNWEAPFSVDVSGSGTFNTTIPTTTNQERSELISISQMPDNPIEINDSDSRFNNYPYSSKIYSRTDIVIPDIYQTNNVLNNFHFTNDIEKSKRWDEYKLITYNNSGNTVTTDSGSSSTSTNVSTNRNFSGPYGYVNRKYKRGSKIDIVANTETGDGSIDGERYSWSNSIMSGTNVLSDLKIWSSLVYYDNTDRVVIFGDLFHKWMVSFAAAKSPSNVREYLSSSKTVFLVKEFLKSYPILHECMVQNIVQTFTPNTTNREAISATSAPAYNDTKIIGIKNEYVKYVQYTLKLNGYNINIDGEYGRKTAEAVIKYQTKNNLTFIDGIVDSQTKSLLAIFWLRLKKVQPNQFIRLRDAAPDSDIKDYIDRAVQYSDISNIGNDNAEYRKISFTGVRGPSTITDHLVVQVPANTKKIRSVLIESGAWNTRIKKIWLYNIDLTVNSHIVPNFNQRVKAVFSKEIDKNIPARRSLKINLDNRSNIKYIMIEVEGDKVNGLGPNAEGYSIKDIVFDVLVDSTVITNEKKTYSGTFSGKASGKIKGTALLNSGDYSLIDLKKSISSLCQSVDIQEVLLDNIYVDTENIEQLTLPNGRINITQYSPSNPFKVKYKDSNLNSIINNSLINYSSPDISFSLNPTDGKIVSLSSIPAIVSVSKTSMTPPVNESISNFVISNITSNISDARFTVQNVTGNQYNSEQVINRNKITNYYIKDADNSSATVRNIPSTISADDGLVVLSDQEGRPIGFPNFSSIINSAPNANTSFGYINLVWGLDSSPPYGLRWEFYNVQTKKFYGRRISYYDYINDNPNNIYVALLAYDLDGEESTKNISGGDLYELRLSPLPTKLICPLYSVKVVERNKIFVSAPPKDLSKFDSWFVEVGRGKFYKNTIIPQREYTNFIKNYSGKSITCLYDTTDFVSSTSNLFGTGFYDVIEESPIIVSDNQIRLRHGSVHVYQMQINIPRNRYKIYRR